MKKNGGQRGGGGSFEQEYGDLSKEEKDPQPKKKRVKEIYAKTLEFQIAAVSSSSFQKAISHEQIKAGKYKYTYAAKRSEQEIMSLLEKRKIKLHEDDKSNT